MSVTEGAVWTDDIDAVRAWINAAMPGQAGKVVATSPTTATADGRAIIHLRLPSATVAQLIAGAMASGLTVEILAQIIVDETKTGTENRNLVLAELAANPTAQAKFDAVYADATQSYPSLDDNNLPITVTVTPTFGAIA